jgi:hypothetical protein
VGSPSLRRLTGSRVVTTSFTFLKFLFYFKRRPASGRCAAVLGRRLQVPGPPASAGSRPHGLAGRSGTRRPVSASPMRIDLGFARRVLETAPRRGPVDSAGWSEIAHGPSGVEGPNKVRPAMSRRRDSRFGELFSSYPSTPAVPRAGYPPLGPGGATLFEHRPASGEPMRSIGQRRQCWKSDGARGVLRPCGSAQAHRWLAY